MMELAHHRCRGAKLARHIAHLLLALAIVLPLGSDRPAHASGEDPAALIEQFLADYQRAFSSGNPLLLHRYDSSWRVFQPLLLSTWFDHVSRSNVELSERQVISLKPDEGTYQLSFTKAQEDIQQSGMFTRGLAGIRMEVKVSDGHLEVLNHRTLPPGVAVAGYRSGDPRSWGEEHSLVERYLYRGLEYLRDGDIKNAEEQVSKALDLVQSGNIPEYALGSAYFSATCYYYSAMLNSKSSNFSVAIERLEEALAMHPDFPAALNLRADMYFNDGEFEVALQKWQRSLELFPNQPEVREIAALIAEALATSSESRRALLLSLVNLPASRAIQLLAPRVKKRPRNDVLVPLLAKAHVAAGDPEKALEVLETSRLPGKHLEATYLAGRILLKMQRHEEALERLETVWQKDPDYRDTLVLIVALYAGLGQYRAALAHLDGANPEMWGGLLHALQGKYNLMAGRFLDAVSDLEEATAQKLPARVRTEVAYMLQQISRQRR
jgi:tetratricopeptide (TPR) repeat protein